MTDSGGLVEGEILLFAGTEKVVEKAQAFIIGYGTCAGVQPPKIL